MKRAKIFLMITGLLAVVGGALAFKAHRVSGTYFCSNTITSFCPIIATTQGIRTTRLFCTDDPEATQCDDFISVRLVD